MIPLTAHSAEVLSGEIKVPGDKSISHRALMIGALAVGQTRIEGLLEGEDVLATAQALKLLGVDISVNAEDGSWTVSGRGVSGLCEAGDVLDMGNSGTAARLLMGVLAGHPFTATLTGDDSLKVRPMGRVIKPLSEMGAVFKSRSGDRLPISIEGQAQLLPIEYELPVASAQVKSAILLAGLSAPGMTRVIEPKPTRDHTELMLSHFGADLTVEDVDGGGRAIGLRGQPELIAQDVMVPGDISSAAFPIVAALLNPGSRVKISGIGVNPLRSGLIDSLLEMGASLILENERRDAGEPVADLVVEASSLRGVEIPASRAPSMIDEYPILAVAAACATGTTRLSGLRELRVKESDRLGGMARGLAACGVDVEEGEDFLVIHGSGMPPAGGATIETELDHRMAMSFLVLGGVSVAPVTVDDGSPIETSFPGFSALMNGLGCNITETL